MSASRNGESPPQPPWFDPGAPDADQCVIPRLLQRGLEQYPQRVFALFEDGSKLDYGELHQRVARRAAALRALGVAAGDRVLLWLPNSADLLCSWFAINALGACCVPINTAARGDFLSHMIVNSAARLMIAHHGLCDRLRGIPSGSLLDLVVLGGDAPGLPQLRVRDVSSLESDEPVCDFLPQQPRDETLIIYTSGTTGPSKGVIATYCHMWTIAAVAYGYTRSEDRMLVNMPLFHVAATAAVIAVLMRGASLALFEGFDGRRYWSQVCETGSTIACGLVGTMAQFLGSQPPRDNDADNPLRMALMYPISEQTRALAKRFGFSYVSGFGTTELPIALIADIDCAVDGSCGRPRSGLEWRLVDEHDIAVPPGTAGELIVRPEVPWSMMNAYNGMPHAGADAWRNGWYHSGDLFRRDEAGYFYYVDRRRDSIRRRGENVSSFEIENVACGFAQLREAAAVGVPAEHGEEEILLVVAAAEDARIDARELFEFLRGRLAHFMLPRYIRCLDELPKTPTSKVRKHLLREQGVTPDTWDREAAGITIRRDRLRL